MRVKSPEEMVKALENCAKFGPCGTCAYDACGNCRWELMRDAAEVIRTLNDNLKAIFEIKRRSAEVLSQVVRMSIPEGGAEE